MKQQISEILEEISFKELFFLLSDVDNKIQSLHECSTEDFLTFNKHLKKYSEIAERISANATEIFDVFSGKDNKDSFHDLNNFHGELIQQAVFFEKYIDTIADALKGILDCFDQLFIPLKNLNQNLLTIKFVNENLKFNINYFKTETNSRSELLDTVSDIDSQIQSVKLIYPELDAKLFALKSQLKIILTNLTDLKESSLYDVAGALHLLGTAIQAISKRHKTAIDQIPKITESTKNYFANIEKIITNLQYHDIIRQKMQHIQKTHKEAFMLLKELEHGSENSSVEEKVKLLVKIRDITGLQVAQLLHTNKQYQTSIQIITSKFTEIADDLNNVAALCKKYTVPDGMSRNTHYAGVEEKLNSAVNVINQLSAASNSINKDICIAQSSIKTLVGSIEQIKIFEQKLTTVITNKTLHSTAQNQSDTDLQYIVKQVESITVDIQQNVNSIHSVFDHIKQQNNDLLTAYCLENKHELSDDGFDELKTNISQLLQHFADNNLKIRSLLDENNKNSVDFSNQIKASIEQVKYYDFFENIIEDIIRSLNAVYNRLNVADKIDIPSDLQQNLSELIARYTTNSEHLIHGQYAEQQNAEQGDIPVNNENEGDDDDDNLELF